MNKRKAAPQPATKPTRRTPPVESDQLLTISEAARRLGIGRTKLYELMNTNQLPYIAIPGAGESTRRISVFSLNAWIKAHETLRHPQRKRVS